MGGYSSNPQVRVNFFTERGNLAASAKLLDTRGKDQIISVTTNKDIRQPAGTFQVTLTGETLGGGIVTSHLPGTRKVLKGPGEPVVVQEDTTEVTFQRNVGWKDWLKAGDLVVIEMGPDRAQPGNTYYARNFTQGVGGTTEIVMVGTIDDVFGHMSIGSDGKPQRAVTVSGRDFGSYLIDDMITWNAYFDPGRASLGFLGRVNVEFPKNQLGGNTANVIDTILRHWIFEQFDVEFDLSERGTVTKKGSLKLSQILRYVLDNSTPVIPFFQSWVREEGAPWSIFQKVQSPPWYFMHIDVRRKKDIDAIMGYQPNRLDNNPPVIWNTDLSKFDSQVALLYYRNPHSNRYYDDWVKLPTRVITADDLVEESVGTSRDEIYNRWQVTCEITGFNRDVALGKNALEEKELERRFGIRPRELQTPFISGRDLGNQGSVVELVNQFTRLIRDWDVHNLVLLNGSLTIKGMAAVRVGDRLHYYPPNRKRGIDYYVEGVRQEFIQNQSWKTTLQVTRGQRHRDVGQVLFDADGAATENPSAMGDVSL